MKVSLKTLLLKSLVTAIPFGILSFLVAMLLNLVVTPIMNGVMLIILSIAMLWAMAFRKGTENIFEGIISLGIITGMFMILGEILKINPVGGFIFSGVDKIIMLFLMLFISEGIVQRLLKNQKWI